MKVQFVKTAVKPKDFPVLGKPELAVVGRSNAGKSSFLNALVNQKIARVSQTPGKTRQLQFFLLDEKLALVDMPGYGFATGNRREVESWRQMIETYLLERESLTGVLLIMDIRREWAADEEQLKEWFEHYEIRWALVLNKADKLSRSVGLNRMAKLKTKLNNVPMFVLSSAKKEGFDPLRKILLKEWTK